MAVSFGCQQSPGVDDNTAAVNGRAASSKTYRCDLEVWADTAASRNQPDVQKLRGRILSEAGDVTKNLAGEGAAELDKYTDSTTFCVVSAAEPRALRVITLGGHFPADWLERWGAAADARLESIGGVRILRKGDIWFAQANGKVLWADSRAALEAALGGRIRPSDLDHSKVLAVRMTPRSKLLDVGALAKAFGVDASEWEFVTVSMDHGGKVSDFVVTAKSPASATRALDVMRSLLAELNANREKLAPRQVDRLAAEATGAGAALRFAGSLEELLKFLGQLAPRGSPGHQH
jgi:hypothetical protein